MDYFERVGRAVDYIENNLTDRLELKEIAAEACCSLFHFHRVFSAMTGLGLKEYIRERRLTEASRRLTQGDEAILEIALDCGFSSQESFTRAFKDAYTLTPGALRREGVRYQLRARLTTDQLIREHSLRRHGMEPKITSAGPFTVIGMTVRTRADGSNTKDIPLLWDRYIQSGGPKKIPGTAEPWTSIGACGKAEADGYFTYIAGELVVSEGDVPDDMETWTIPAATYAVFSAEGPVPNAIQDLWKYIYGTWLPASKEWDRAETEDFELYDDRMHASPPVVDIYIPVKKKE